MTRPSLKPTTIAALVLLVATAGDLALWSHFRAQARALAEHGVTTLATVTEFRTETRRRSGEGRRRDVGYIATYAFTVPVAGEAEPMMVEVEHDIPRSLYERLDSTERVEIRYLPEDPSVIEAFPGETAGKTRFLGWVGLILGTAAGMLLYVPARKRRRAADFESRGVTTIAVVESVNKAKSSRSFFVRYTDGLGVERRVLTPTVDGLRWRHVQPGATVPLRYDRQDPRIVALA